jgi:hypothetical protein
MLLRGRVIANEDVRLFLFVLNFFVPFTSPWDYERLNVKRRKIHEEHLRA